ncbi:Acrylyl-CoA reductase AcuI [Sulfitobacter pontiacus]|uniref:Acrylyl-CoA reductase AcuI n=1 Tax=Sulfitobacter pontiacus TaxID=60137 RepID=A0A1H2TDG6_9RHOB|nr:MULTISPECIES: acryloyl-CoA reductase [Sulfitobacter]NKX46777.1 oxidoreductase [Rhodobacteraceae bacterium R_SAG8]QLL42882.1 oxidoreductase [Sulfitobacter pontiacus]QPO07806.1 oxidoreductase [Sulfitobacter sp. B30-2]UOA23549.1 Acrylyl-CoA reductase AcuI [Sulfitobacter pontiacus]UWR18065.1 acryloyl-CoA reductase [Sulfitobacter pontiacus]
MFDALMVNKDEDTGKTHAEVTQIDLDRLPEGDVTVAVEYSTVNYKDGLCIGPGGGLVRKYPHIPGIDFAGTVEASDDDRYKPGDKVVLTGWRVGEAHWGGYAQKARVKADWLVPLPEGLDTRQAMAVGTAGFTAMLSVMALEDHGLVPGNGPVLVTGAAGGVGSVAVAILAALGHEVAGVTGRPDTADYLKSLGATQIVAREELNETVKRPLESETWAGCIDAVGGEMLARVLGQMKYGGSVAAVGLAGGAGLPATVIPFLLRGVNLLGIDSVMQPYDNRLRAWQRIGKDLPLSKLEDMVVPATLSDLPKLGADILNGQVRGRVVVDVNG